MGPRSRPSQSNRRPGRQGQDPDSPAVPAEFPEPAPSTIGVHDEIVHPALPSYVFTEGSGDVSAHIDKYTAAGYSLISMNIDPSRSRPGQRWWVMCWASPVPSTQNPVVPDRGER